jgi:gliding motility-associated-like protein
VVNSSSLSDQFYSVVVTDANDTVDEDTVWVQVYPSVGSVDLGGDVVICPGESVELDATLMGATSYSWSNGLLIPNIVVTEPGTYFVQVNSACETDIDSVVVFSGGIEVPDFVSEYVVCDLDELLIGPSADSVGNYTWLDDPTQDFPRSVFETGTYPFEVNDNCGVRVFEVVVSEVNCDCVVYVPNGFTPNGDNINDAIAPVCECGFTQYDFRVYNRWGDLIFQTNNPNQSWVGSSDEYAKVFAPDGVYNWSLNGVSRSINGDLILQDLKGSINLVR